MKTKNSERQKQEIVYVCAQTTPGPRKRTNKVRKREPSAADLRYKIEHRDEINAKGRRYHAEHKEHCNARSARYKQQHKEDINNVAAQKRTVVVDTWREYLLKKHGEFKCCACQRPLQFSKVGEKHEKDTVVWDHRTGDEPIRISPSRWLHGHAPTPENIAIWEECNFGMLCLNCNLLVGKPQDRKERLQRFLAYARK